MKIQIRAGEANRAREVHEEINSQPVPKRPILAKWYRAGGIIALIGVAFGVLEILIGLFSNKRGSNDIFGGMFLAGWSFGAALISFGLAELIEYIGKAAHFAERCSDSLHFIKFEAKQQTRLLNDLKAKIAVEGAQSE